MNLYIIIKIIEEREKNQIEPTVTNNLNFSAGAKLVVAIL